MSALSVDLHPAALADDALPCRCGKKTWWGCGGHVQGVMDKIPVDEQCQCDAAGIGAKPARPANVSPRARRTSWPALTALALRRLPLARKMCTTREIRSVRCRAPTTYMQRNPELQSRLLPAPPNRPAISPAELPPDPSQQLGRTISPAYSPVPAYAHGGFDRPSPPRLCREGRLMPRSRPKLFEPPAVRSACDAERARSAAEG